MIYFFLTVFLVYGLFGSDGVKNTGQLRKALNKSTGWVVVNFFVFLGLILVVFLTHGLDSSLNIRLKFVFSFLVAGHVIWGGLMVGEQRRVRLFVWGWGIILFRLFYPTVVGHNLLVIFSIVWLGAFLRSLKILTKRRFILLSVIWLMYDVVYVWLSPLAQEANRQLWEVGFPLGIIYGENLIGTGDLLWANLLLSVISKREVRLMSGVVLVISDLCLGQAGGVFLFPLLVLWVPLGLAILFFDAVDVGDTEPGGGDAKT